MRALLAALAVLLAGCLAPPEPDAGLAGLPLPDLVPVVEHVAHVDPNRWSGEPSILAMKDGTLLVTGVGGMTRYAEDPTDIPGKFGQSYLWRSTDGGKSWQFVDLGIPQPAGGLLPYRNAVLGVEGDLAEDDAGNAYFVDLTMLALNGLSVSKDSGATWTSVQNPVVGLPVTDRPWVAAIGDGHVWVKYLHLLTGTRVARSDDGGMTFRDDVAIECGNADVAVDRAAKELLVPCVADGAVYLLRAADGPLAFERIEVAKVGGDAGLAAADFPSVAVAATGHYVVAWREAAEEGTAIRYATSLDRGATWSAPASVDAAPATRVFPWVDANEAGLVGLVWYETPVAGDPETLKGDWFPRHASFRLDAAGATRPVIVNLTADPVHTGAICTSGLMCVIEGRANDRRLLDFFEVDVDEEGRSHVSWTSTKTDVPTIWYGRVDPGVSALDL